MKTIKFILINLCALFALASCSKSNNNDSDSDKSVIRLKVEPEIGQLSQFITIADTAVIKLTDIPSDSIECKALQSTLPFTVNQSVASNYSFTFEAEILDKDHIKLAEITYYVHDDRSDWDFEDYHNVLDAGSYRAESDDQGTWDTESQAMWETLVEEAVYIAIKPRWSSAQYVSYSKVSTASNLNEETEGSLSEDSESVTGDEDWDEILNEYDSFVTNYVSLLKKAKAGDASAMTEYVSYMEKAQSLATKLSNAESNMSAAQLARYTKISTKMASAAASM